jgi:hypothetical protein
MSPLVQEILALKPELRLVPDELRIRVQSIRVRSQQDTQPAQGWRQRPAHHPAPNSSQNASPNRWRHGPESFRPAQPPRPLNRVNSFYSSSSLGSLNSPGPAATPVAMSVGGTPGAGSPVLGTPALGTPGAGTPGAGSPAVGSPVAGTPGAGTPGAGTPGAGTPGAGGPVRYVSRFHNGSKKGDDEILNTIILNKLNIFSVKTYDDVKQFLFQILGSDQREFVREFTWLVFRKAAAEDKFCGLFAKLLSEIKKEYPVILEEMRNLHTTYLDIWKVKDTPDVKVDKRCRLGYSQFLAELTALEVLEPETMKATMEMLKTCIIECLTDAAYKETVEEYMDCLRQLCSSKVPKQVREMIRGLLVSDLETWIQDNSPGLSSKSRFACMDLRDLLVK